MKEETERKNKEIGKEGCRRRRSRDVKVNREDEKMIDCVEEIGWSILNGNIRGNEEGKFTFTGTRGNTVIDYIVGEKEAKEGIRRMKVGEKVDSDHHPVEAWIERKEVREVKRRRRRRWTGTKE